MQGVPEAAAYALKLPRERMPPRQLYRRSTALVVDRVHQGAVLRAHVNRLHRTAAMLKDPLGAQQKPRADRVQSFECGAVHLDMSGAFGIQTAQYGVKAASLADDPRSADDQVQRVASALQTVPCSCLGRGNAQCAGHDRVPAATAITARSTRADLGRLLQPEIMVNSGKLPWRSRAQQE